MNHATQQRGFTLVELIVAIGIFGFAATFAVASLLALTGAQRKAAATQDAFDNVRYAMDFMSREMKQSKRVRCVPTTEFPCMVIGLVNAQNRTVAYGVQKRDGKDVLMRSAEEEDGVTREYVLIDPNIQLDRVSFYVSNMDNTDIYQPFVTIVIKATAGNASKSSEQSRIHLQTSSSLLSLDRSAP